MLFSTLGESPSERALFNIFARHSFLKAISLRFYRGSVAVLQ